MRGREGSGDFRSASGRGVKTSGATSHPARRSRAWQGGPLSKVISVPLLFKSLVGRALEGPVSLWVQRDSTKVIWTGYRPAGKVTKIPNTAANPK
jgi:hypothetical protein